VVLIVHHGAIGGAIDPVLLGVAHDHEVVGADEAAAVMLVQERHRKLQQVDLVVAVDIFQHRAAGNRLRRNRTVGLHAVAVGAHHVERLLGHRQAHRNR
jgi:hypothetical protein